MRSFPSFILGVVFDADGKGYLLEFSTGSAPYTPYIRSINFATGALGGRDNLALTGGAKIWKSGKRGYYHLSQWPDVFCCRQ